MCENTTEELIVQSCQNLLECELLEKHGWSKEQVEKLNKIISDSFYVKFDNSYSIISGSYEDLASMAVERLLECDLSEENGWSNNDISALENVEKNNFIIVFN